MYVQACMCTCRSVWHAPDRQSAKHTHVHTVVKITREQRHPCLYSQAKWLVGSNQQRLWKDRYLSAFHLCLTLRLSLPPPPTPSVWQVFSFKRQIWLQTWGDRDAEEEWARKRGEQTYDGMSSSFQQRLSLSWQMWEQTTGVASTRCTIAGHCVCVCVCV